MKANELKPSGINYHGWKIIDPSGLLNLADRIRPAEFSFKNSIMNRSGGLHITYSFGKVPTPTSVSQMQQEIFNTPDIMSKQIADIVEYACNENIEAFRVSLNGHTTRKGGKKYHITLAFNADTLTVDENGKSKPTKPVHSWMLFSDNSNAKFRASVNEHAAIFPLI